jgi:hypothetical protein
MILVEIVGGLANQMIGYAAGRALAEKNGDRLKLDLTSLKKDALRTFELKKLRVDCEIATEEEIAFVKRKLSNRTADRVKEKIIKALGIRRPYIYKEPSVGYDENFFRLSGDVHIKGDFISWRYFEGIESLLRREFRVRGELSRQSYAYEKELLEGTGVGIHVRRGDYAVNPHTTRFHGLMGVEYYAEAMEAVEKTVADPVYHVFSDDLDWARENLRSRNPIRFVDHVAPDRCEEDMHLMSRCRHNIIANSTFSYWGAWLNPHEDKIVIAPKRWFADAFHNRIFDLLPPGWIRI